MTSDLIGIVDAPALTVIDEPVGVTATPDTASATRRRGTADRLNSTGDLTAHTTQRLSPGTATPDTASATRRRGRADRLGRAGVTVGEGAAWIGSPTESTDDHRPLVLACGALLPELRTVLGDALDDRAIVIEALPANLHNRPDRIVPSLEPRLAAAAATGRTVFVAYADCGTGGHLDQLLARYPGVQRLPGAHCYESFVGSEQFARLHDEEPGSLYLTDFLAKHFDSLIWAALGLDRHPALRNTYFGNYRRVVLLSQQPTPAIVEAAASAASKLGLGFVHVHTGLAAVCRAVESAVPVSLSRSR